MKVLQLIDSLRPGGAERMAVSYANALASRVERSYLCCTRMEGMLKKEISPEVGYYFLRKKRSLDWKSLGRLAKFVEEERIDIVHAHSTSFYFAALLKVLGKKIKLVWHDHYGESEFLHERPRSLLSFFSTSFDGIIAVNSDLQKWSLRYLNCAEVIVLNNFIEFYPSIVTIPLSGGKEDVKIVCVANLRPQKSHDVLLRAFEMLDAKGEASLHLIGRDPETKWSQAFLQACEKSKAKERIFYYGIRENIPALLSSADIGVLSSRSEGLPLALLEYAAAGLPIVCTDVGRCAKFVGEYGRVIAPGNPELLRAALREVLDSREESLTRATKLRERVIEEYSEKAVMQVVLKFYEKI